MSIFLLKSSKLYKVNDEIENNKSDLLHHFYLILNKNDDECKFSTVV